MVRDNTQPHTHHEKQYASSNEGRAIRTCALSAGRMVKMGLDSRISNLMLTGSHSLSNSRTW